MLAMIYLHWSILLLLAYLLGSIPFGLLIGFAKGVDIRESGSGNIGATNTGRVLGKAYGYTCFALDLFKGLLPTLLGALWLGFLTQESPLLAQQAGMWLALAVLAMMGHIFPVWLKFKGGKGVATGFGVLLGVFPYLTLPALGAILIWIICVLISRYISLSSIIAACALPLLYLGVHFSFGWDLFQLWPFPLVLLFMAVMVVVKHRSNIGRLMRGEESKIFSKKKSEAPAESEVDSDLPETAEK